MRIFAMTATVLALTTSVQASDIYVDSPEGCAMVRSGPDGDLEYAAEGGLLMNETGYSSLEYFCSFTPRAEFQWHTYSVSTHVGQCEMPGPEFIPQLFTILLDPMTPGVISVFTGDAEPLRFSHCPV